jgi:hypothetical protein
MSQNVARTIPSLSLTKASRRALKQRTSTRCDCLSLLGVCVVYGSCTRMFPDVRSGIPAQQPLFREEICTVPRRRRHAHRRCVCVLQVLVRCTPIGSLVSVKNQSLFFRARRTEFESWRDFSQFMEHKVDEAESRDERRWMEKQNANANRKRKQAELHRIGLLVSLWSRGCVTCGWSTVCL